MVSCPMVLSLHSSISWVNQREKRGRYFNEVPVPDFWEVSGDNSSGKVTYYGQEKARIAYHTASYKRIVERLEWLDDKGQVVMIEHYDQYGRKIAVTTCGDQGQAFGDHLF